MTSVEGTTGTGPRRDRRHRRTRTGTTGATQTDDDKLALGRMLILVAVVAICGVLVAVLVASDTPSVAHSAIAAIGGLGTTAIGALGWHLRRGSKL